MVRDFGRQILLLWKKSSLFSKVIALSLFTFILFFCALQTSKKQFVALYDDSLDQTTAKTIRGTLKGEKIPFKEKGKGHFLVPIGKADQLRKKIEAVKDVNNKGLELLDSNTWIKGEKELQMLEWRALKGQLEKEIAQFEHVSRASIILDLCNFNKQRGALEKPKISCILSLEPGSYLSSSCLTAMISHLVSGVRGLDPTSVAISDTSGKLYKKHGSIELEEKNIIGAELEHHLRALLEHTIGKERFILSQGDGKISLIFDEKALSPPLLKDLQKECLNIVQKEVHLNFDTFPFTLDEPKISKKSFPPIFYLSPLLFLALIPLFLPKKKKEEEITKMIAGIDIEKLINTIKKEKPSTIALFLSYLDPGRAEKVITALPTTTQAEVYHYLSAIEDGDA